ncbi:MAG TPA: Holliday junction resolvase RuvX [Acidimicrobiales bacterium]|nr:Holliday junction resolvase RuvX [Acidimicrobiales bacterium]
MARILGIDPGTRRCGIAISDSKRTMAFPRESLAVDERLIGSIARMTDEELVDLVVVGRPVALSGNQTQSTALADDLFVTLVDALSPTVVVQWDERLTTTQAQRSLSGAGVKAREHRGRIDSAAAVIMLQNYLDALHTA